ncbi:hypothetical protein T552_01831 [Pneumocystis carinii B80]|uniref:Uncharacterized protein n=1 Tax=Pneumocystis carinii (strain B80) TaxID=1408658 RepID=A0A0W4ZJL9_PNEC8|nr:hypothetical protein T552_01831 [Pneumocystis carinii B80]KTW28570.1 hypothetical protein T552_01831 [Pneumocystis carinii B80]
MHNINQTTFLSAIQMLNLEQLHSEISMLNNSIKHLIRSNNDLKEYTQEAWAEETIKENEQVIIRQKEKIEMISKEIEKRNALKDNNTYILSSKDV